MPRRMLGLSVALLFCFLFQASAVDLPGLVPPGVDARGSILIEGDAGFRAPFSGVRAGSGTADDPYVISGWTILQAERDFGIRLVNTSAHVVIEDVEIPLPHLYVDATRYDVGVDASVDCLAGSSRAGPLLCLGPAGVDLMGASNVTVRRVRVLSERFGIRVVGGSGITLADLALGQDSSFDSPLTVPFIILGAEGVVVRNVSVRATELPPIVESVRDLAVESSRFEAAERSGHYQSFNDPIDGLVLRDNVFRGVRVQDARKGPEGWSRVVMVGNRFEGDPSGVSVGTLRDALFCGNSFDLGGGVGLWSYNVGRVRIVGNTFLQGSPAIQLVGGPLEIEGNVVRESVGDALALQADGLVFRNNSLSHNPGGHEIAQYSGDGVGDLRWNWWGAANGPAGIGGGDGDPVRTFPGRSLTIDPWLVAPPEGAVDCSAEESGWRARSG